VSRGAFHYAKDSGNVGRNSNGKLRFCFFRPERSKSPLEVVHLIRLEYSDRNSPFHFRQTDSLPKLGNSEKEKKVARAIPIGWPSRYNWKMSFHFLRVFPLISDLSVWHNGKHPKLGRVHSARCVRLWRGFIFAGLLRIWGGWAGHIGVLFHSIPMNFLILRILILMHLRSQIRCYT